MNPCSPSSSIHKRLKSLACQGFHGLRRIRSSMNGKDQWNRQLTKVDASGNQIPASPLESDRGKDLLSPTFLIQYFLEIPRTGSKFKCVRLSASRESELHRNKVRPRLVYEKFSVSLLICGNLKD